MSDSWMSRLSDNVNLSQLAIPGTHDSHSTNENLDGLFGGISAPYVVTQSRGIHDQLLAGARYLDLRVGEGIRMRHGKVQLKSVLHDCLREIQYFLDRHPSETVLVHIMWDHDGVGEPDWFTKHVGEQWYQFGWYSGNEWPTLGGVRKRAVLLRRFKPHPDSVLGVDVNGFFSTDVRTESPGKWHSRPMGCEADHEPEYKWKMVREHLEYATTTDPNDRIMYFTNLAGAKIKVLSTDDIVPGQYASILNPKLTDLVSGSSVGKRLGVVQVDYLTEAISQAIYNKNF